MRVPSPFMYDPPFWAVTAGVIVRSIVVATRLASEAIAERRRRFMKSFAVLALIARLVWGRLMR